MELYQGDCLKVLKDIPDDTVDLVLTDPPYNINVTHIVDGKKVVHQWDKIDNYIPWCMQWLRECHRVLKPNGVLYFWHNSIPAIAELMMRIKEEDFMRYVSFCIWDKGGVTDHGAGRTYIRMEERPCGAGSIDANTASISSTEKKDISAAHTNKQVLVRLRILRSAFRTSSNGIVQRKNGLGCQTRRLKCTIPA